jgi:hypothetical protein
MMPLRTHSMRLYTFGNDDACAGLADFHFRDFFLDKKVTKKSSRR